MELINEVIKTNKKEFPVRIHVGNSPKYIFITHHGMLSNKTSWRYFEKFIQEESIVLSYDARVNGDNALRASRLSGTYTRDLRDVVRYAKKTYPGIKTVVLGSSWGAAVVADYAKKYGNEVFKSVSWSVPYRFSKGEDAVKTLDKSKINKSEVENKTNGIKETTPAGYAWRFALMLPFNINTKSNTKIDLTKTANNRALERMNKITKPQSTPVKLFWATVKHIWSANKNMVKVNKRNKESELLYFQSTIDAYLEPKKLKELKKNSNKGLKLITLDEGKHAFQWETENKLNERVFQMMLDWLKARS